MADKTYIVVQGGLTQGIDHWSGSLNLWMKLLPLRSPVVSVEFFKWDSRFSDLAERIFLETGGRNVRIVTLSFSYGGGWALPYFANECREREMRIETAVMCDAVWRSKWAIGKWMAFVDWPIIRIPDSVDRVIPFIQRISRPRGHRIVAMDSSVTTIDEPMILGMNHVHADDSWKYHEKAIEVAKAAVAKSAIERAVEKQAIAQEGGAA